MKYPNCGKEIANDSQFCEFCGTRVINQSKLTSQRVGKYDIVVCGLLVIVAISTMYNLFPLYYNIKWYLGINRINIIFQSLPEVFLPMLSTSFAGIFLYNAWKHKDALKNASVTKSWLLWCLVCAVLNVFAGCIYYIHKLLTLEGAVLEYVFENFIFLEIGNMIMVACFAVLLWWKSKQSEIDNPIEIKLLKPLHILFVVLILSIIIIVV